MNDLTRRLADALTASGHTLSTAESCTAGGLAHTITRVPGASAFFVGGVVAYANTVKSSLLGVSEETLGRHGAVSAEVAEEMATSCRRLFSTDLAVSITGIAGPSGGAVDKPVGLVFVAVSGAAGVRGRRFVFPGDRDEVRARAATAALEMLLDELAAPPPP